MPRKAIIKNGELFDIVVAHEVINYIIDMLETGTYDPKIDKLKVITEEQWENQKKNRLCR